MGKLSVKAIRQLTEPGRYSDGDGLYLHIRNGGSRQWVLRTTIAKRRVDIGLGSAKLFSLTEARDRAREHLKSVKSGGNPLRDKRERTEIPSFEKAARAVYKAKLPTWKNGSHKRQWIQTLEDYAFPHLGSVPVNEISSADILATLSPLWNTKEETARRLKQRLKVIFDWAIVSGFRDTVNPVVGVKQALPKQKGTVKHHEALPWKQLPKFMEKLDQQEAISALALKFLILTIGRSADIREAQPKEIDLKKRLWIIPAERMKMARPHRVPLCSEAVSVIERVSGMDDVYIFPGQKGNKPLSNSAFSATMIRMGYEDITTHGFRSTFKDWCSEIAKVDWEVSELALAHQVGNETERAYARSDLLDRRRVLMDKWSAFACSKL